jgi:hypothetical protein
MFAADLRGNIAVDGESASSGGAVFCTGNSSVKIVGSMLRANRAEKAGLGSRDFGGIATGGAIAIFGSSSLVVETSELLDNVARESGFWSQGGAIGCFYGSNLTISSSKICRNSADLGGLLFEASDRQDAGSYGGALDLEHGTSASISDSEVSDNLSDRGSQWSASGGINAYDGILVLIVRSRLVRNVARGGGEGAFAGAMSVESGSSALLLECEMIENAAKDGGSRAFGGAIKVVDARLTIRSSRLGANTARGGKAAEGGALFLESGAFAEVTDSELTGNIAVQGSQLSSGGAICLSPPFSLEVRRTRLMDNRALGLLENLGGAISAKSGQGSLLVSSCRFLGNLASSESGRAAGGALNLENGCTAAIVDSELSSNQAMAATEANGGGLYFGGQEMSMRNTTIAGNRALASGTDGEGLGGGIFLAGASMESVGCRIFENVAGIRAPAIRSTGGGIFVTKGGRSISEHCTFHANTAGGLGFYDGAVPDYLLATTGVGQFEMARHELANSKGAYVYSQGVVEMHACTVGQASADALSADSARWLLVASGSVVLDSCRFDAHASTRLGLLNALEGSEVLISGCTVTNLDFRSLGLLGVVNSSFEPPLNTSSLAHIVQSPNCDLVVAGENVCDPRAQCMSIASGVQCNCSVEVGAGLRYKQGAPQDGRHCEQESSLRALLASESVTIAIAKPGILTNRTLTLIAEAQGEAVLNIAFNVHVTRESNSGTVLTANGSIRLDQPSVAAFGQHIEWMRLQPAATWQVDLGGRLKFADTRRHEFTVRLACDRGEQSCTADGDIITTALQLASPQDGRLRSEVRVAVQVQSLLSCMQTRAATRVEPDSESVPRSAAIRVQLFAYDVDNLPINFTRAEIHVGFGDRTIPMQWSRGSNVYIGEVSAELTALPGLYDLVVRASNAWNETARKATSCELLRRSITVQEGLSTSWILVGASGAAVIVAGGLFIAVRKRHAHLQAIMAMLLTEMGMLVFAICTALANLVTDGIVFGRLLRGELTVSTEIYTVAYATILCFGVVVTALSLGYRIRNARLMKAQLQQLAPQGQPVATSSASAARRQLQQHEWELVQTHRTKVTLSLSLMTVAAQGARAPYVMRACAYKPRGPPFAVFCRPADVCLELLPDLCRGQHRQDGARRRPRAWALRPPFNAHAVSCGRSSRRFRSRWCSWASSSAR